MRLVVVTTYVTNPAEGMHAIAQSLVDGLRAIGHDVAVVAPHQLWFHFYSRPVRKADAIVFTHGPGFGTVLRTMLLRFSKRPVIWICTRPRFRTLPAWLARALRVALVIGNPQDTRTGELSTRLGARFVQVLLGGDLRKFAPGKADKHVFSGMSPGIELGKPILLHVGHLRRNRGLERLVGLKLALGNAVNVIVIGSPTLSSDRIVVEHLQAAGIVVYRGYLSDLAAYYRAADLYVFPTSNADGGAIDLPLSVLEALACGTPVLSVPFGLLPRTLGGKQGVFFVPEERFVEAAAGLINEGNLYQRVAWRLSDAFDIAGLAPSINKALQGAGQ
jgi:glycosyltransferase involved in cell wall biosynthesis